MKNLSIIVPTYNERGNILVVLDRLFRVCRRNFKNYEILVVDDNSPDETSEVVKNYPKNKHLKLFVRHERGLASAVKFGIGKSKYETVCVMDADLLHEPETIPKMMSKLNTANADIVIASRFIRSSRFFRIPKYRVALSKIGNLLVRIVFPKLSEIRDPLTGFFLFRKSILKGVKLKTYGFKILLEMLIKSRYNKAIELPSRFEGRVSGKSKLTFAEHIRFLRLILYLIGFQLFTWTKNLWHSSYKNLVMR